MKTTTLTTLALAITLLAANFADAGSFRRGGNSQRTTSTRTQQNHSAGQIRHHNVHHPVQHHNALQHKTTNQHHFGNTKQNVHHLNHHNHSSHKSSTHHQNHKHHQYHLHHGKKFHHGYSYHGKNHHHWTKSIFITKYGCKCHWCPATHAYYYWCAPHGCYYPVSYCPTGQFAY